MIADLINVSLHYITKETVDVSKLCATCKVHSEGVCIDKSNSVQRSPSSLIGSALRFHDIHDKTQHPRGANYDVERIVFEDVTPNP